MKRDKQKYMRILRHCCPYRQKYRKRFFVSISQDIDDFISQHPDCNFDMIVEEFGKPEEVFFHYSKEMDLSDMHFEDRPVCGYIIATACTCSLLVGLLSYFILSVKNQDEKIQTAENVVTETVEDVPSFAKELAETLLTHNATYYDAYGNQAIVVRLPDKDDKLQLITVIMNDK